MRRALLPFAAFVAAQACAQASQPARDWVVTPPIDDAERDRPCPRLLSAAPNVTEVCCALGLVDCLVGRTRYCDHPPAVRGVPSIGALNDLNVEVLLSLKPELILVSGHSRAVTERLARLELRYEPVPDTTLADLFTAIHRIGELTNRPASATRLVTAVRADLDTVTSRWRGRPPVRVLIVAAPLPTPPTPPTAAGPGSFYDDLLRRGGHANVADTGRPFAPLSLEFILRADPDVIIELVPDEKARPRGDANARAAWAQVGPLKAVRTGRVHALIGGQHFVLGPRIAQTYDALCRAVAEPGHE